MKDGQDIMGPEIKNEIWKQQYIELFQRSTHKEVDQEAALQFKLQYMPRFLYRYRNFDPQDLNLKSLESDTIWLSGPKDFNDPFDSSLIVSNDRIGNEYGKKILPTIASELFGHIAFSDEELNEIRESENVMVALMTMVAHKDEGFSHLLRPGEMERKRAEFALYLEELSRPIIDKQRNILKVGCFSENYDSNLMWSHYANNHTGFCIGYDFKPEIGENESAYLIHPVIYSENIFDCTHHFFPNDRPKNFFTPILASLHKSSDWNYEKEWRLVHAFEDGKKQNPFPIQGARAVYLGARISEQNKEKLISLATKKGLSLFKMELMKNCFRLQATELK